MSKYRGLTLHLASLDENVWVANFSEIEDVLGFPLPDSAYSYPAWWANQSGGGHSQSSAWQSAGWKTSDLDLRAKRVRFYYEAGEPAAAEKQRVGLTIPEAKEGLAAHFGVGPENIEIIVRG